MTNINIFKLQSKRGFTLVEVLLVIAILAILAAFTIIAINPARQLSKSRNAERSTDTYSILNAIHQYAVDHDGAYPLVLTTEQFEICGTESVDCTDLYDLSVLTDDQEYLVSMPDDPHCGEEDQSCTANGVGYFLQLTPGGKVTISAPNSEIGEVVTVTR